MRKEHRYINLDIDTKDERYVADAVSVLDHARFDENVTIMPSAGGKGYHIRAWLSSSQRKGYTWRRLCNLRAKAHDDPVRILLDKKLMGLKTPMILFHRKVKT